MSDVYLGLGSLVVAVISTGLWIRALQRVAIPKNRGGFVAVWIVAAGLGGAALAGDPGWIGGISASLAVAASMFFLFTFSVGGQKVADDAIRVGTAIPRFTAIDEHGHPFDSESLAGHPVLIKFFRGHW